MEIREFIYNGTLREVIVVEENDISLKGYDVSKLSDNKQKEVWRTLAKDIDMSKFTEEEQKKEYEKFREAMKFFRHFKKSQIK